MKRSLKFVIALALLAGGAGVAVRVAKGPSGASAAYGGSIAAALAPEFPKSDAASWVNGTPTPLASLKGSPVLLEIWSPT